MKPDYFELISPSPFVIQNTGRIKRHTLHDITMLTARIYSTYLALLHMTPEKYCSEVNPALKVWYDKLPKEQASLLTMYDIAVSSPAMQQSFSAVLNFFFVERVVYDHAKDAFVLFSPQEDHTQNQDAFVTGMIHKSNYSEICNIILQLNHIDTKEEIDLSKVKSKKGLARYMEMQKRKKQIPNTAKADSNMELGNIISAVCTKHNSINYTNVWNLTVCQLWDTFARLRNNDVYESGKTSVSVWGDKENKFDFNQWYKNMR